MNTASFWLNRKLTALKLLQAISMNGNRTFNRNSNSEIIRQSAETLLSCENDFALMKQAVDQMYQVFSRITGITIDQLNGYKDVMLPSGKAISPPAAAHCLLELRRTAVFLRGINKAISQKLQEKKGEQLRILYAGTGPYGTLVIPLLLLYYVKEIKVDLLDINPDSLTALQKIIMTLGLSDYIGEVYCLDATTIKLSFQYDIVVSETMQACLKNEPQVAVMQNIIPQLDDQCFFIPEEISIDASLVNPRMEMDRMLSWGKEQLSFERCWLSNVYTLNRHDLHSIMSPKKILIPGDATADFPVLKLFTTVKVFEDEVLTENNSSLNMPKQYYDFREQPADEVEFWYVLSEKPGIESKLKENNFC